MEAWEKNRGKMKKIKILIVVLAISLSLVACSTQKSNTKVVENVNAKEYKNIDNGAFYVNNKGIVISKEDSKKYSKIVEWYFDPLCSHCVLLETEVSPYITEIMGENTLIKYVPMSFLGRPKGSDEIFISYSDTISSNILSIAENDPENVFKYIKEVVNQSFIDKISKIESKEEQDKIIEEIYTKTLSGKKLDSLKNSFNDSLKTVRNSTKSISKNEELKSKTASGKISVPLVYVVGEDKALIFEEGQNPRKLLEEKLK